MASVKEAEKGKVESTGDMHSAVWPNIRARLLEKRPGTTRFI
jgi:hypothetical protein